jgi:hypothetical protein
MSSSANKSGRLMLSDLDVERIAAAVAVRLQGQAPAVADPDPELTRAEAAKFCRLSLREFDRERSRYPKVLTPSRATRPVLFRRSTLEIYRARRPALASAA